MKVPVVSCCSVFVKSVGKGKGDSTVSAIIDAESSETPPVYITSLAATVTAIIAAHVSVSSISSLFSVVMSTTVYSTTGATSLKSPVLVACGTGLESCKELLVSDDETSDDTCGTGETTCPG